MSDTKCFSRSFDVNREHLKRRERERVQCVCVCVCVCVLCVCVYLKLLLSLHGTSGSVVHRHGVSG